MTTADFIDVGTSLDLSEALMMSVRGIDNNNIRCISKVQYC